jgi:hypothetical protein
VSVAAGFHGLALRRDGSLAAWGNNSYGQTNCPAGTNYSAITAGDFHSVAIRDDGTLVAWGWNQYSQTNCPKGHTYTALAAGYGHSLAILLDPFLDITNDALSVGNDVTSFSLAGTNAVELAAGTRIVGAMWWTNRLTRTRGSFPAEDSWLTPPISLNVGANVITVSGTNVDGIVASDTATIVRGPVGTGTPFVDITNGEFMVDVTVSSTIVLAGTNNMQVMGNLWISNAANGMQVSSPASQSWISAGVTVELSTNLISVFGSNLVGLVAHDTVMVVGVPEPTAVALLVMGCSLLVARRRGRWTSHRLF